MSLPEDSGAYPQISFQKKKKKENCDKYFVARV